jgi:hypothetical protein
VAVWIGVPDMAPEKIRLYYLLHDYDAFYYFLQKFDSVFLTRLAAKPIIKQSVNGIVLPILFTRDRLISETCPVSRGSNTAVQYR